MTVDERRGIRLNRRRLLQLLGGMAAATAAGIPLYHYAFKRGAVAATPGPRTTPGLGSWEDLYRQRWTWDRIVKGSHGWANCRSACAWDMYVKGGVVVREEQTATYSQSEPGVPDFNPRGCQKGACYTEVMYGPSRTMVPLKRVGPRGSGRWERIGWEQALREIATGCIDALKHPVAESVGGKAVPASVALVRGPCKRPVRSASGLRRRISSSPQFPCR